MDVEIARQEAEDSAAEDAAELEAAADEDAAEREAWGWFPFSPALYEMARRYPDWARREVEQGAASAPRNGTAASEPRPERLSAARPFGRPSPSTVAVAEGRAAPAAARRSAVARSGPGLPTQTNLTT
jgi:hypothetical protein